MMRVVENPKVGLDEMREPANPPPACIPAKNQAASKEQKPAAVKKIRKGHHAEAAPPRELFKPLLPATMHAATRGQRRHWAGWLVWFAIAQHHKEDSKDAEEDIHQAQARE
mmetsp:Transcript_17489/g.35081  ORF Transcript_17489/g.35081 Transcript_17489/m.35081 type:complete len:111 (-) Transcript_17489:79-411(-)